MVTWLDLGLAPDWNDLTNYFLNDRVQKVGAGDLVFYASTAGTSDTVEPDWTDPQPILDGTAEWTVIADWAATTAYDAGDIVQPVTENGHAYGCVVPGTSAGSAPTFPTNGATVDDGTSSGGSGGEGEIHLDVYDYDHIFVARLEGARDKLMRWENNAFGGGSFTIHADDANADQAILAPGHTVRVTVDPIDSDVPIGEFILEDGDFELLNRQEQGGKLLSFGGRGTLAVLTRGIIPAEVNTPYGGLQLSKQRWHFTGQQAGDIIARFVAENIALGTLADITRTFSGAGDTDGVPFSPAIPTWNVEIGINLWEEVVELMRIGLVQVEMRPGLILDAYQSMGNDHTGTVLGSDVVIFREAVNIATDLRKRRPSRQVASDVLVRGSNGKYVRASIGTTPYKAWTYIEVQSDDPTFLETSGEHVLGIREAAEENIALEHKWGMDLSIDEGDGIYLPAPRWLDPGGGHYWLGDLVTLDTEGEWGYVNADKRVMSITLTESEAGFLNPPLVELGPPFQTMEAGVVNSPDPQPCGDCPCNLGQVVANTDPVAYYGGYYVGAVDVTLTGAADEHVAFWDGTTVLPYTPGTATLLVGTAPGPYHTWVPDEFDPQAGVVSVTGATGDARVVARVSCTPLNDPPEG